MVSMGIINDSMQFETLPVSQGDVLVRGPSRPVRGGAPGGPGGALSYYSVVGLVCPRGEEQISGPSAV